jgi:hypothetical protein
MTQLAKISYTNGTIEIVEFEDIPTLLWYTNHDHVLDVSMMENKNENRLSSTPLQIT